MLITTTPKKIDVDNSVENFLSYVDKSKPVWSKKEKYL